MLERVVLVELFPVACGHFDMYMSTKCVLVETLKSEDNCQHFFLYLSVPGFCTGKGTTCVLNRLAVLEYRCTKATLAWVTLYGEVL